MVTNRKKIRNLRRTFKIVLAITISVLAICAILGYLMWTVYVKSMTYISPLSSKTLSAESSALPDVDTTEVEDLLKDKQIEFISVKASKSAYLVLLKNNVEVILSTQKDLKTQISSLQFISFRLTMESRQFSRLDLRFDKPIIVFK